MATSTQKQNRGEGGNEAEKLGGMDEMARKHKPATIIRAPKDKENPYKAVRRATFEDKRLTWEERGILGYLLVKPDHWEIDVADLWRAGNVGRDKIYRMLAHLEKVGYLEREITREKGQFAHFRYLLHEEPLPEKQEMVDDTPFPENQDTVDRSPFPEIRETVDPSPLPEKQEMATRVTPFPETPDTVNQEHSNKEEISNKEQPTKEEEMNERMNSHSFIHSSSVTDAQDEFVRCFDLLTDPEVGLDDTAARALAGAYTFEFIERQIFAWQLHRDKGGVFSSTGALLNRFKSNFSAPPLTAEQRRSALYTRFHEVMGDEFSYTDFGNLDPHPDDDPLVWRANYNRARLAANEGDTP